MNTSIFQTSLIGQRRAELLLLAGLLAWATGCSARDQEALGEDGEGTARVTLALSGAPPDVACVVVHLVGQNIDRRFNVVGGNADITLGRLPVGPAVVTVETFADCSMLTASSAPTWVGGPVTIVLHPGPNNPPPIPMRRSGTLNVGLDFSPATTPVAMVAEDGAPCTASQFCRSNNCLIPPASDPAIGTCQPAAASGSAQAVQVTLDGEEHYLFYPVGGGDRCPKIDGEIYTVTLPLGRTACLDLPTFASATAVELASPQRCQAGQGCEPCQSDDCQPASCFPSLPVAPMGEPCAGLQVVSQGVDTRYLILRKRISTEPQDGLPLFVQADIRDTISVTPPTNPGAFAYARLGDRSFGGGGGSCGATGLCGVLEFSGFLTLSKWGFLFKPDNLTRAPAF